MASQAKKSSQVKKYNLSLPLDVYDKLQEIAEQRNTTVVEIIRRFITLGFIATEVDNNSDAALLIKEGDTEKELILY